MTAPTIFPPSTSEVAAALEVKVTGRELIRQTAYSHVELIHTEPESVVLKTVIPELRHEVSVSQTLSGMPIAATEVLASHQDAEFPWMAMKQVPGLSKEPGFDDLCESVELAAGFHAMSVAKSTNLPDAPDRTVKTLLASETGLSQLIEQVFSSAGQRFEPDLARRFFTQLQNIERVLSPLPVTLVHGDFDPGNLVFVRGKWRALDWGLSHRNVPLVDLAHMSHRFPGEQRTEMHRRYFNSASNAGLEFEADTAADKLVDAAVAAHFAFFVWWHSHCIVDLGVSPDTLVETVISRVNWIADFEIRS